MKSPRVPLLDRVFAYYEEGPVARGVTRWHLVDNSATLRSFGWSTAKERRDLDVTSLVRCLSHLAVGDVYINDDGLGGRTKFKRVA